MLHADGTAYVESAQACGLHLVDPQDPLHATTYGVGQAIEAALDAGARRIVVGLGGSATNDGGAGLLAALGATADVPLDGGPGGARRRHAVDLAPARARLDGIELVIAADVDVPLLGMFGATKTFGPQKGLTDDQIIASTACSTASSSRPAARRRPSAGSPTPRAPARRAASGSR